MLVEQFLHIMLNQDDPRFFVLFFSTAKYIFLHYAILGEIWEKSYANVCKAIFIQNHQEDCNQQVCLEVELCCRWRICN